MIIITQQVIEVFYSFLRDCAELLDSTETSSPTEVYRLVIGGMVLNNG